MFLEAREIVEGLLLGADQVPAGALLFDEKHALPEQVDEPALFAETLDWFLETGDAAAGDPENLEELVLKGLALAPFIMGVPPFLGETGGAGLDLIPAKAHRVLTAASHHKRFAVRLAGELLVGFGVAGEARAGPQIELVPGAVADVGQVAQIGAVLRVGNGVVKILDVARAAGRQEVLHVHGRGVAARAALGVLFHDQFAALALVRLEPRVVHGRPTLASVKEIADGDVEWSAGGGGAGGCGRSSVGRTAATAAAASTHAAHRRAFAAGQDAAHLEHDLSPAVIVAGKLRVGRLLIVVTDKLIRRRL